ncbi:hypothetical protein D3C75_1050870 [compost metagenome]
MALGIERREVLVREADRVAQHAQVAVAAARQQEHQPHGLGRGGRVRLFVRQVVQIDCGLEDLLRRGRAHAGPAVQHAIGRGGRHAGAGGHIRQPGQSTRGSTFIHIKNHHE